MRFDTGEFVGEIIYRFSAQKSQTRLRHVQYDKPSEAFLIMSSLTTKRLVAISHLHHAPAPRRHQSALIPCNVSRQTFCTYLPPSAFLVVVPLAACYRWRALSL